LRGDEDRTQRRERKEFIPAPLRHDGEDLWFCSQACLRRFLDGLDESAAVA
jgi:hypothetical protein